MNSLLKLLVLLTLESDILYFCYVQLVEWFYKTRNTIWSCEVVNLQTV